MATNRRYNVRPFRLTTTLLLLLSSFLNHSTVPLTSIKLASASAPAPLYTPNDTNSAVQIITHHSQFQSTILNSDSIWVVQFYANWCGHCQKLAPVYQNLSSILKGIVNVAAIEVGDSNSDFAKRMLAQYNIQSFPTVYIFAGDKQNPVLYKGNRDAQSMIQETLNQLVKVIESRANLGAGGKFQSTSSGQEENMATMLNQSNFKSTVLDDTKNVWLVAFIAPWYVYMAWVVSYLFLWRQEAGQGKNIHV